MKKCEDGKSKKSDNKCNKCLTLDGDINEIINSCNEYNSKTKSVKLHM